MKTMRVLFAIAATLLVSGYTFATGKGPGGSKEANLVREKIATAIEQAEIEGQGQVTLKFGVDENKLQILKIESTDAKLSQEVKDALADARIMLPKGVKGFYQIKVSVNEQAQAAKYGLIRDQVYFAVSEIEGAANESVDVKLRVVYPSMVQVLKAESVNKELAEKVKETLESESLYIPKKFNGEYSLKVSFK